MPNKDLINRTFYSTQQKETRRCALLMSAAVLLALPLAGHAEVMGSESGPSTFVTKAAIVLVDASGRSTKIEPMLVKPKSGSKVFSYTWKYIVPGSAADTTVSGPVKIILGKVNAKDVTSGYHMVKVQREGNTRKWSMKQGSDGFYPDKSAQVYKLEDHPLPQKDGTGVYSIKLPKALSAGSYFLMTASEGWEFEVK